MPFSCDVNLRSETIDVVSRKTERGEAKETVRSKNKPRRSVNARDQRLTNEKSKLFDDVAVIDISLIHCRKCTFTRDIVRCLKRC